MILCLYICVPHVLCHNMESLLCHARSNVLPVACSVCYYRIRLTADCKRDRCTNPNTQKQRAVNITEDEPLKAILVA